MAEMISDEQIKRLRGIAAEVTEIYRTNELSLKEIEFVNKFANILVSQNMRFSKSDKSELTYTIGL